MASQQQLLQELFILATGRPANTPNLAALESIVGPNGDLHALDDIINSHMNAREAALGTAGIVQAVARTALGRTITAEQANNAANDLKAAGLDTWAKIFHWLANDTSEMTTTLNNRADATVYFTTALKADGKTDLFEGQVIWSAATNLIQTVDSSTQSLANAKDGLDKLSDALSVDGIQSAVIDGYVKDAFVFADANGNGRHDDGEWSGKTDANGNYKLPRSGAAGTIIATGGTDIMTNKPFQGVLTAPSGSTVVNPLTTLVQALVDSGQDVAAAQAAVSTALGLPADVNPLTYDPLRILASSTSNPEQQSRALDVQAKSLQIANVITQAANAINSASGSSTGSTLLGAAEAVTSALANAIKNAAAGGGTIDL
ncbi:MAG: hypothetical protein SV422_14760, partial [Pseudomonadota bacterium]|nr:hypothetical protein [Pseudomonadota bacterium]